MVSEDELVSLDELQEKIAEFEDYVQSTDVAAMQSKSSRRRNCIPGADVCCRALSRLYFCGRCFRVGEGTIRARKSCKPMFVYRNENQKQLVDVY